MSSMAIATEIFRQMGGNKFAAMVGAKDLTAGENSLSFKFKMFPKANHCKIVLNGLDLYDVVFSRIRKKKGKLTVTEHENFKNLYDDQLVETFEETTGLTTKLF